MSKTKKHILSLDDDYEYEMIGICSHHNDYRLAWGINEKTKIYLEKADQDFIVVNKKGLQISNHSLYEFKDDDNMTDYFLIKNKNLGKYLIPEKPSIDYFVFIFSTEYSFLSSFIEKLKTVSSVLGIFHFDPTEIESTENLVFR